MNYKFVSLLFFTLLLSCQQINSNKNDKIYFDLQNKFKNSGFALVYNEIILKWNRSLRFALAVCTLKDKIKNEL